MQKSIHFLINISIKSFLLVVLLIICLKKVIPLGDEKKNVKNICLSYFSNEEFESEFKKYICSIIYNHDIQNCINSIFNNLNFFNEVNEIKSNFSLLIDLNQTNIENLFILIATIPFLANNSIISYNIKNIKTFEIIEKIFEEISEIQNFINIKENEYNNIKKNIINVLNYTWETIPNQNIINIIRYIINNYYEEQLLELFDIYLNSNFKYYLSLNALSLNSSKHLISKYY